MKKSIDTDKQCIERIILHITELSDCIIDFTVISYIDLKNSKYAKYVITQLITNIYELSINIRTDTLKKLNVFNQIELFLQGILLAIII